MNCVLKERPSSVGIHRLCGHFVCLLFVLQGSVSWRLECAIVLSVFGIFLRETECTFWYRWFYPGREAGWRRQAGQDICSRFTLWSLLNVLFLSIIGYYITLYLCIQSMHICILYVITCIYSMYYFVYTIKY